MAATAKGGTAWLLKDRIEEPDKCSQSAQAGLEGYRLELPGPTTHDLGQSMTIRVLYIFVLTIGVYV
jgi:hypothetical protein